MRPAEIRRYQRADGALLFVTRAVAPRLSECVRDYCGYEDESLAHLPRLEVPHPRITVILNLGARIEVHAPELERPGASYGSFVAGLFDTAVVTRSTGLAAGIELNVTPLGTWQLFGVPMSEFCNAVVRVDELPHRWLSSLETRLLDASDWDTRFDLLDAELSSRLALQTAAPTEVRWAMQQMHRGKDALAVSAIAKELQWSRRRLASAFREHVGMAPKRFARVMRFDRAARAVRAGRMASWSALAYDCGYADQAHLSREFQEFAGLSPTEFARRMEPEGVGLLA